MSGDWPEVPPEPDRPARAGLSGGGGGSGNLDGGNGNGVDRSPEITSVKISVPGEVTISGLKFGAKSAGCSVTFTTGAPGAQPVPTPEIRYWSGASIRAALPQLGVGGAVLVTVIAANELTADAYMSAPEASAPASVAVTPAEGVAGATIAVTGLMFGYPEADGSPPPGATLQVDDAPANIATLWGRTRIEGRVPANLTPGNHTIRVYTPWGPGTATFVVHAPPVIKSVSPAEVVPDGVVTLAGQNFGPRGSGSVIVGGLDAPQVPAEIVGWSDDQIQVRIPGRYRLGWGPGETHITVATGWGGPAVATVSIALRSSITSWARIEPHQRADDLDQGLRLGLQARVSDAAWLLSCQWRLREYELEDSGSPIAAAIEAEVSPLARWRAPNQKAQPLAASPPLETLVEREPRTDARNAVRWSQRFAVEAGMQFLRMIAATKFVDGPRAQKLPSDYLRLYPVAAFTGAAREALDAPTRRFLDVVANRAVDGARLHVALRGARPAPDGTATLPPDPKIVNNADRTALLKVIAAWYRWCDRVLSEGRSRDVTWDPSRSEYAFAVSADTATGEAVLVAQEYDGRTLDWYDFVVDRSTSLREGSPALAPATITRAVIPAPVTYAGMPAPRWWQFEDAQVDFGAVDAAPADLAHLLVVEFATVYGNDWFVVPLAGVTAGSLVRMTKVELTNTFGDKLTLDPLARSPHAKGLHLFELNAIGAATPSSINPAEYLFLPATIPPGLESAPVERVDFVRDETANLAWAVETVLESPIGIAYDQAEAYAAARQRAQPTQPVAAPLAPLVYRLRTDVPPYWIPFVPVSRDEKLWLQRSAMPDGAGLPIPPRGRLLEGPDLFVYDEEVPREGAQVTRSYQYTRGADGATFLWLARRRRPGALRTTSGLRFDSLDSQT